MRTRTIALGYAAVLPVGTEAQAWTQHDGRHFIVVSVGGNGEPAELVALALPMDQ